jgi:phosphatidylserine/phosphatidylglycerophosphate/cardiolipin synthase-like enzyme
MERPLAPKSVRLATPDVRHGRARHDQPPPRTVPRASRVEWLIDNAAAYDAILRAIASARHSVWISQLAFDADCTAHSSGRAGGALGTPRNLIDALVAASMERDVDVRILLNASLLLDTAKPLRAFLEGVGASGISVRGVGRFPQLLHAKMVIVDGNEAFLVGSPFVNGYWDDECHKPVDDRRPVRELGGRPLHDVSTHVHGAAVARLGDVFIELWNDAPDGVHGNDLARGPRHETDHGRSGEIRVACTTPRRVSSPASHGRTEILAELCDALASARSLVYIEHQYLSARPVVRALVAALATSPALEIIVVLNQNPDVTAYRGWQNARLRESGLLEHPRVGLFTLWSVAHDARRPGVRLLNQIFVHSKVVIVDDRWVTVGSANLDGVSLHSYGDDFAGRLGRRVFCDVRNFDVNVVLDAERGAVSHAIRALRTRLWDEHLGPLGKRATSQRDGDWLARWRAAAEHGIASLAAGNPVASSTVVLPYSTRSTPRAQLADAGISADEAKLDLRFNPGWLEVNFSPSWVRNMFA